MNFLLTGTRVYGPATEDSDLDIVVKLNDVHEIVLFLAKHGIIHYRTPGQDLYGVVGGFYFDLAGITINIIIAESGPEFKEWERRTERMKKLSPIEDRGRRIDVFNEKEPPPKEYTCHKCKERDKCAFVDDLYNTGGECLAMK